MAASLDVVIPALNEEEGLPASIPTLHRFLSRRLAEYRWRVVIADNGSTDSTPKVAERLSAELGDVAYTRLEERGRGRALKRAWLESDADMMAYMDLDLSSDLNDFPALVDAVHSQGYDLAIGSRLMPGSTVVGRSLKRETISRCYSLTFRGLFLTGFRDAQCGFKLLSRRAVREVVPLVQDTGWFFDTELLILAEKNGYAIKELPITWTDDPDSRVKIVSTAYHDLKGLTRLRFGGLRRASKALAARRRDP